MEESGQTDSLAGPPCGKGSHRTRGEVFVGNGDSKIRMVHFVNNPCEVNCLKGTRLKQSSYCLKEYVTLGLLIASCIFNYVKDLEKRTDSCDFS